MSFSSFNFLNLTEFYGRCVGEVRRLAAGGVYSAPLTDACCLEEFCEFRLAESVDLSSSLKFEDVACQTGADALARLCEGLRYGLTQELLEIALNYSCN